MVQTLGSIPSDAAYITGTHLARRFRSQKKLYTQSPSSSQKPNILDDAAAKTGLVHQQALGILGEDDPVHIVLGPPVESRCRWLLFVFTPDGLAGKGRS